MNFRMNLVVLIVLSCAFSFASVVTDESSGETSEECAICNIEYREDFCKKTLLACSHELCESCLAAHISTKNEDNPPCCPFCRRIIDLTKIKLDGVELALSEEPNAQPVDDTAHELLSNEFSSNAQLSSADQVSSTIADFSLIFFLASALLQ